MTTSSEKGAVSPRCAQGGSKLAGAWPKANKLLLLLSSMMGDGRLKKK